MGKSLKLPSKDEIREAREKRKQGRKLLREADRVLRKVRVRKHLFLRRPQLSDAQEKFYTWEHDLEVLARAVVRSPGADTWTADEIARRCSEAADRMKLEVALREPPGGHRRRRRAYREWQKWQDIFDNFVHDMASHTTLSADEVIVRALDLANALIRISKDRKSAERTRKAL